MWLRVPRHGTPERVQEGSDDSDGHEGGDQTKELGHKGPHQLAGVDLAAHA